MNRYLIFITLIYCSQFANAQKTTDDSVKTFLKKFYSQNQKELDLHTTGVGIEHSAVKFGDDYSPVRFNKIVVRVHIAEFKVGVGNAYYYSPLTKGTYNTQVNTWSLGINYPISHLGLGKANSTKGVRLVPFFSADFGHSNFRDPASDKKLATAYHLSVAPGYRIKIPYFIIDFRLNTTWNNLTKTDYPDNGMILTPAGDLIKQKSFKSFNFTPCVSVIIDGLFSKFDPTNSQVSGSMVVYDNISKKDYYTTESYNSQTGKMEKDGLYKTETTYQYHAESITLPVSDVGAFIGIGPRLIYKPVSKNSYRMPTIMGGVGAHGRISAFSMDINIDKGTAGFSSQAKTDGKILKSETQGKGTFGMTNLTANVGIDLGPIGLALLGIIAKRTGQTPYFNICGGIIYGYSFINNYKYNDQKVGQDYQDYFKANPDKRTIYNDASSNKSGIVSGWYIGAEVGAVGFRYEFNKYKNAPLARCAYYTISYKYPLLRSKHKA